MERLTIRGFDFSRDFVASNLQSWPIAQALKKLQTIEDAMEDRELHPTYFDKITASPEALAEFLASIQALDGPWDRVFQEKFCTKCRASNCTRCPHPKERNSPAWFLAQEVAEP